MNLATPFRFAKLLQPLCAALKRAHPGLVTAPSALQHSSFPVCGGVGGFGGWGGVARGVGGWRRGRGRGGVEWGTRRAPPYPEPGSVRSSDILARRGILAKRGNPWFFARRRNFWPQLEEPGVGGQDGRREQ